MCRRNWNFVEFLPAEVMDRVKPCSGLFTRRGKNWIERIGTIVLAIVLACHQISARKVEQLFLFGRTSELDFS